jgi:TolB-like protein/DNA-binding winged helix-turn-helix (wHTH) protein
MRDVPESDGSEPRRDVAAHVRFAGLVLDLDACTHLRESGEAIPLTRGEFALLRAFVTRPGRVISRDTLLDALANRRFEPFDRSVDVLVGRLRRKIEPDPKEPRLIVTVPGEGYRFDGLTKNSLSDQKPPIAAPASRDDERPLEQGPASEAPSEQRAAGEMAAVQASPTPSATPADRTRSPALKPRFGLVPFAAAIAALVVLAAASGWFLLGGRLGKLALAPPLSIVVLPFENLSGDPEQEYFADGITDDLTTDLSHLEGSFVIARGTAFTYKGKSVDAKEIGRELGVRYLLEGSVRRIGEAIAVNAQLVSTETGAHVWADRFEGDRSKLGQLQVDFVSRLANSLGIELVKAEALRAMRERPDNPDAVELAMEGWAARNKGLTSANVNESIGDFERALQLDPELARAKLGLAIGLIDRVETFRSGNDGVDLPRAEALVANVLSAEPNNATAHLIKAILAHGRKQFNDTLSEVDVAVEDDPNLAAAYGFHGLTSIYVGRAKEAIPEVETALRLSPRDPIRHVWEWFLCDANVHLADWEKAAEWCQKSIATNAGYWPPYLDLAAADGWLGRDADAKAATASLDKLMPGVTVQTFLAQCDRILDNPTLVGELRRIGEGLRKAGLPEGDKNAN